METQGPSPGSLGAGRGFPGTWYCRLAQQHGDSFLRIIHGKYCWFVSIFWREGGGEEGEAPERIERVKLDVQKIKWEGKNTASANADKITVETEHIALACALVVDKEMSP
ncbi:hypothetical protein BDK51DRAFT_33963 [Blyttiomyces helicus]|uniref:Uncharacterized protein n=1 Tax=Blyttiomyces helicus TaxID=388810 RepID=A0A4P9W1T8_9FUNG|nr:hypothetical protein BDK51DRAFT_33963 [Blyttiomyces helicus]|eukprot:RKO86159.1 hypothetical protein BDK51DRAFT_33963 [Blyttiomyces helicus]